MLGVICESVLVQEMPEPSLVSALRTERFQQVGRFAQNSGVTPCVPLRMLPREPGCHPVTQEVLAGGAASPSTQQSEVLGKQGAALLSTEKRVILFSLQKYNWVFLNSSDNQIGVQP